MNQEIVAKKLTDSDKQEYMRIFVDVLLHDFPEYSEKTKESVIKRQEKEFLIEVEAPYKVMLGAFIDNQLVGLANGMHLDQGVANLSWLMVDRNHKKKGIGRKLVEEIEKEFIQRGDHSINIYSAEWNMEYYKKLGYDLVGLYKKAWLGEDYYLFTKLIQEPKEENFLL